MPAVLPSEFITGGRLRLLHDDHQSTVRLADLTAVNHEVQLTCGVCGTTSTHPAGGGADSSGLVQALLLRLRIAEGETFAEAKAALRARIAATDGDGRVRVDDIADQAELTGLKDAEGLRALADRRRLLALAVAEAEAETVALAQGAWEQARLPDAGG